MRTEVVADMPRSEGLPNWPEPVRTGTLEKMLKLNILTEKQKRLLWSHLTSHHPRKARELVLLSSDPIVRVLQEEFDGALCLKAKFVPPELENLLS